MNGFLLLGNEQNRKKLLMFTYFIVMKLSYSTTNNQDTNCLKSFAVTTFFSATPATAAFQSV